MLPGMSCGVDSSDGKIDVGNQGKVGVGHILKVGETELPGSVETVGASRTIVGNDEGRGMRKIVLKHVGLTKPVSLKVITRVKSDYEGIQ
jgi:hypothetical protein